jgi:hypothetical protein
MNFAQRKPIKKTKQTVRSALDLNKELGYGFWMGSWRMG